MIDAINRTLEKMYMALNPVFRSARASASKQLEEFRNCNFGSMATEVARLFEADKDLIAKSLRYFNVVGKSCDDIAMQYRVPVQRRFADVTDTQAKAWLDAYAGLYVDDVLALGERQAVAQQCMIYGYWPDQQGRARLTRFLTYQVESIEFDDPWAAADGDLQDAKRVVLVRPAYFPSDSYQPGPTTQFVARVILERDVAYYELPDGTKWGLFNSQLTNPIGFPPVAGTRRALPIDDVDWLPEVAQDMQSIAIGSSLGATDMEHIVRMDVPVTVYATGLGAKLMNRDKIKKLAGGIIPIPDQTTLTPLNTAPAVEKYAQVIDRSLALYAQFRNLSPEGYSGITGAAKKVDMQALEFERLQQESRLRKFERGLCRLIARVDIATQRRALTLEEPKVDVTYVYPRTRENVLQEAQALPLMMAIGLADAVEEIARNEKVSLLQAEDLWKARMERWRDMVASGVLQAPGLDRISSQLDKNGARPAADGQPTDTSTPNMQASGEPDGPQNIAATGAADVQKTALNGAQVASLQAIVQSVADGSLPLAAAREIILASFPIAAEDVDRMLKPLTNFEPKKEVAHADVGQGRVQQEPGPVRR